MTLDQSERCPFFELIDNGTDSELAGFACSRQVDTEQVKSAVKRKIAELSKVLEICKEMEEEQYALLQKAYDDGFLKAVKEGLNGEKAK